MEQKNLKLVLINAAFQMEYYSRRWKLFAETYTNCEVYLLTPTEHEWYNDKFNTFGSSFKTKGISGDNANYHVRVFHRNNHRFFGYSSPDLTDIIKDISPDFIYEIGGSPIELMQILSARERKFPTAKVALFSMRGPALTLRIKKDKCGLAKWFGRRTFYYISLLIQKYNYKHVDAIMCHYPDAVDCFRKEGYNGRIYMQTQVGVNKEWFYKDQKYRDEVRRKYNIDNDTFVFGSASRFTKDKGLDVILQALPKDGNYKYLMMGSGTKEDFDRLHSLIEQLGIKDKVIETGFIDWYEMGKYWNAVDCAVHVPLTTPYWEETFSLAAIQPQVMGIPIIGDTSGSVPYQIGYDEMIIPENNVDALRDKMFWVMNNYQEAMNIAKKMYERTMNGFEVQHLNKLFYDTITQDIIGGKYDPDKFDMANYYKK